MRKLLIFSLILLILIPLILCLPTLSLPNGSNHVGLIRADDLEDVTKKLDEQKQQLADLEKKKEQLAQAIASASVSLAQVSAELEEAEADLAKIQKELSEREKTLKQWETTRNTLIREFYKESRVSPFEVVFSADSFLDSTRQLQYYQDNLGVLRENISVLTGEISTFKQNKAKAEELRNDLADLRNQYSAALAYSQRQLSSTSSQLSQVKSSIKNLTAKQEQLILEKFAATAKSETVGDKEPLSEDLPNPGFAPAWMVATYGYPHRIGMSQYGAYGRAKKGQGYTTILKAYYGSNISIGSYSTPSKIKVDGIGEINFENNYMKGIAEIPSSWSMNTLKAQAIAARTYALYRTAWKNYIGREDAYLRERSICPTAYCQVYSKKKATPGTYEYSVSARWREAVDATKGIVIKDSGVPIAAFYHSTAGGYTISSRKWIPYYSWDNGIKDFYDANTAYEEISGAPWYHTGWGSRYNKKDPRYPSNKYYPWMTGEEFADIFNALLLCTTKGQRVADCDYTPHLSPIDSSDPNKWLMSQVRSKLSSLGITPFTSISAVVTTFTSGNEANTASIYVSGSGGTRTFVGKDFRAMFNLRSRGTLGIWTYRFDVGYCSQTSGCSGSVQFK